jgi:M6 family metalloprotease-like protein
MNRKKVFALALITSLLIPSYSASAAVKAGALCKKAGIKSVVAGKTFTCVKSGKNLVWNKGFKTRNASKNNALAPKSKTNSLKIYNGGRGAAEGAALVKSAELNFTPVPASPSTNLKLWIYDPEDITKSANSPGIFYKKSDGNWTFARTNGDGTAYLTLTTGSYAIDTVEPNGNTTKYKRKTYSVTIDISGKASIAQLLVNSKDIFTLTLDLVADLPSFQPSNVCQLKGRSGFDSTTNGFPRIPGRLPNTGEVKALIIPVDFPDVVGSGNPAEIFYEMAMGMDAYFKKVSEDRVFFSFQILPKFVRLDFPSTKFNLGTWNTGDSFGYWKATLAAADPLVDFSKFDVVYSLSPKTIPWSSIAYGPAFPTRVSVEDGFVLNGTISGADAYQNFPGAGWKWMAHETGHLFGLHDLYTIAPKESTFGEWDLMSLNWTTRAIELNSWNRYITGWLSESQVDCLDVNSISANALTRNLVPLVEKLSGQKAQLIKLTDTKILVMEYRTTGGFDVIPDQEVGVLVFTVDMTIPSIEGGWQVQRRAGSMASNFVDAALRSGDKIVVSGVTIEVTSLSKTSASVKISKS